MNQRFPIVNREHLNFLSVVRVAVKENSFMNFTQERRRLNGGMMKGMAEVGF